LVTSWSDGGHHLVHVGAHLLVSSRHLPDVTVGKGRRQRAGLVVGDVPLPGLHHEVELPPVAVVRSGAGDGLGAQLYGVLRHGGLVAEQAGVLGEQVQHVVVDVVHAELVAREAAAFLRHPARLLRVRVAPVVDGEVDVGALAGSGVDGPVVPAGDEAPGEEVLEGRGDEQHRRVAGEDVLEADRPGPATHVDLVAVAALLGQVGVPEAVPDGGAPVLPEHARAAGRRGVVAAAEVGALGGHAGVSLPVRVRLPVRPRQATHLGGHLLQQRRPGTDVDLGPAPEGPVWEHDVHRGVVLAVAEQRRCGLLLRRLDLGHVLAVEHEVQVRDASGVARQQLRDAPLREGVTRLEHAVVRLHVRAAVHDHQPERRPVAPPLHRLARDPRLAPRRQVGVDEAEVIRALRRGLFILGR
jgi:hypothetical protein